MQKVDYSEKECIILYAYIPRLIEKYAVLVNISEQYYHSGNRELLLIESAQGQYWIIISNHHEDDIYWLFPITKLNGRINPHQNEVFNLLFNCENFSNANSRKFILKKPAQVYPDDSGEGWILQNPGILDFSGLSLWEFQEDDGKNCENIEETIESEFPIENDAAIETRNMVSLVSQVEFQEYIQQSQGEINLLNQQLNDKIQQLITNQQKLQEEVNLIRDKYHDLESNLETKLTKIESQNHLRQNHPISKTVSENLPGNTSGQIIQEVGSQTPSSVNIVGSLSPQEMQIVGVYNSQQFTNISQRANIVGETDASINNRHQGKNEAVVLEIKPKGFYWLYITRDKLCYMMPIKYLTINQTTVASLRIMFEYSGKETSKFKLLKPAKVMMIENTRTWKLTEKGIIEFE